MSHNSDEDVTHASIAAAALARAVAIVQAHPSHPVTPTDVLHESLVHSRGSFASRNNENHCLRFHEMERRERDLIWTSEVKCRLETEQRLREFNNVTSHYLRMMGESGCGSPVSIAAQASVLKVIAEHVLHF